MTPVPPISSRDAHAIEPSLAALRGGSAKADEDRTYPSYSERHVRVLLRGLISCPKAFAAEHRLSLSHLHQQLRGARAVSLRVTHAAQRDAGRWPIDDYLLAVRGADAAALAGDPGLAALLGLTRIQAELGTTAHLFDLALSPDSDGGSAFTPDEARMLEPEVARVVSASQRLLAHVRTIAEAGQPKGAA